MNTKLFSALLFAGSMTTVISCKKNSQDAIVVPPVIVNDANLRGWIKEPKGAATVEFVKGPLTPLLGNGSVQYKTPDKSFARLLNTSYGGTPLSSISELSYSAFVEQRDSTVDTNACILEIDNDGDGYSDFHLVFEPRYQTGKFVAGTFVPDQGPSKMNTWQTWDAFHGGWFIFVSDQTDPDHSGVVASFLDFVNKYPNATIVNDVMKAGVVTHGGGIRVQAGGPIFSKNFIGYVDNIKIGVKGVTTTYDFE